MGRAMVMAWQDLLWEMREAFDAVDVIAITRSEPCRRLMSLTGRSIEKQTKNEYEHSVWH
jgi:hypothetical protein